MQSISQAVLTIYVPFTKEFIKFQLIREWEFILCSSQCAWFADKIRNSTNTSNITQHANLLSYDITILSLHFPRNRFSGFPRKLKRFAETYTWHLHITNTNIIIMTPALSSVVVPPRISSSLITQILETHSSESSKIHSSFLQRLQHSFYSPILCTIENTCGYSELLSQARL